MKKRLDLLGQRFGLLVAIKPDTARGTRTTWLCVCDCGNNAVVTTHDLRGNDTQSCGCLSKQNGYKHGHDVKGKVTPEYRAWQNLKNRCYYFKGKSYHNYGGRGITVCEQWMHSFEAFYNDVGERPSPKHSIDRIDVNGNYEPSNVRWATSREQRLNQRPKPKHH